MDSNPLSDIEVDISVELGSTAMPVHQLLRMGRGAVIELETLPAEHVIVKANDTPIAEAEVVVDGERISVSVMKMIQRQP